MNRNSFVKTMTVAFAITVCAGISTMAVNAATVSGQTPGEKKTPVATVATTEDATAAAAKAEFRSVETIFSATSVPGVTTNMDAAAFGSLAGLTEGEKGKMYVGDVYKSEVRAALKEAAAGLGGNVISMLDIDFYALSAAGIRNAGTFTEPVTVAITLPGRMIGENLSVVSIAGGTITEYQDIDDNAKTFTISTKQLGAFALIQK